MPFETQEQVAGPLGMEQQAPTQTKPEEVVAPEVAYERAAVKRWLKRIMDAKAKWKDDFDRMRENMDFVAGWQWKGQVKRDDDRYMADWTIRNINQKVATLYARNPKVAAERRKRLDFQMWNGRPEMMVEAVGAIAQGAQMGAVPPAAMALIQDYQRGREVQQLVEKVSQTLEILFQYQTDCQEPDFKVQAKQFVTRAAICGVAYVKVKFCRSYTGSPLTQDSKTSLVDRAKKLQSILQKLIDGKIDEDSAEVQELKSLGDSLELNPLDSEAVTPDEHLTFEFPQSTSIIVDKNCKSLRGFVSGRWIAEEFVYPIDTVNALFELRGEKAVKASDLKDYTDEGAPFNVVDGATPADPAEKKVRLYEVYDLDTRSSFIVCEGYKDFVQAPAPVDPAPRGFWTIFPLVFNSVEVENGCKSTIYPPSDVDLVKHSQREWNRTRNALREQRKANAPKYMTPKGTLTAADLDAFDTVQPNGIIELQGIPPNVEPGKVLQPLQHSPIDPMLYDTKPLSEDMLLTSGQQEANVGPAQPNVTATVGTIAEQSRLTVASSNVDDLDDCLSAVARCGGEMLLREMSLETVQRIVGPGAVWPQQNKEEFVNEIELRVVAASSGRPNKALEINNWNQLAPLLLSAGANPQAVIAETVKRLDDRLDPSDFFPPPVMSPLGGQPNASAPNNRDEGRSGAEQVPQSKQGGQPMNVPPSGG